MSTNALTKNNADNPNSQTYLQQCTEDLSPSQISSAQWKSSLWRVAAVATYVAFAALTIGGIALAMATSAMVYIPVITVSALFLLKFVQKGHDQLEKWSDEALARAEQLKKISHHHQELASVTSEQLQQLLQQKGIPLSSIPNPDEIAKLKPLVARHTFWEGHVQELEKKKQEKIDEAAKLSSRDYTENADEIYDLHCEALEIEKRALESKVKNAFINAVIQRPDHIGSLDDLGSFSKITGQEHAVGNAAGNAGKLTEFFKFKNEREKTLSFDEVKSMTVFELAGRIVTAL